MKKNRRAKGNARFPFLFSQAELNYLRSLVGADVVAMSAAKAERNLRNTAYAVRSKLAMNSDRNKIDHASSISTKRLPKSLGPVKSAAAE